MTPGPIALVGSGEYLPVMEPIEAELLAGRPRRYVQIPTAAAREGATRLRYWVELGAEQARRLGVEAVPVVARDRSEADEPAMAELVRGAGLIYLSGGNPTYLTDTLRDSLLWRTIRDEWQSGAALAGCSAGAMALTGWVPQIRNADAPGTPGLGVLPHLRVIPHFDRFTQWMPDLPERYTLDCPEGTTVLGIDEETALIGGPEDWRVAGRQSVWVITPDGRAGHPAETKLRLPAR